MHELDLILALTEQVEHHVERGEWAEAGALDADRCRLLADLFASPDSAADLAGYREVLEQLLLRNQHTIERVTARREQLTRESASWPDASRAVSAYRRNTGPGNLVFPADPEVNEP
jgi:hypothetical protein